MDMLYDKMMAESIAYIDLLRGVKSSIDRVLVEHQNSYVVDAKMFKEVELWNELYSILFSNAGTRELDMVSFHYSVEELALNEDGLVRYILAFLEKTEKYELCDLLCQNQGRYFSY